MKNVFMIFHKSYQIDRIETTKNIENGFIKFQLEKQLYSDFPINEFWVEVKRDKNYSRYKLVNGQLDNYKNYTI